MQQKRLLLALLISAVILFGWTYVSVKLGWSPPPKSQPTASPTPSTQPSSAVPVASSTPQSSSNPSPNTTIETNSQRKVRISTPLYEVTFDSNGAVVTSWVLKRNQKSNQTLYSSGGDENHPLPLELVSQEGLKHQPREAPFQIYSGDSAIDLLLNSHNYKVEGSKNSSDLVDLNLTPGQNRVVTLSLADTEQGIEFRKSITFDADNYATEVEIK